MMATDTYRNKLENLSEGHKINPAFGIGANDQYKRHKPQETKYQCPMNCEGNKTYNQPGVCPVCNMQLVLVGNDEPKIQVR